jgi:hypothetical protein
LAVVAAATVYATLVVGALGAATATAGRRGGGGRAHLDPERRHLLSLAITVSAIHFAQGRALHAGGHQGTSGELTKPPARVSTSLPEPRKAASRVEETRPEALPETGAHTLSRQRRWGGVRAGGVGARRATRAVARLDALRQLLLWRLSAAAAVGAGVEPAPDTARDRAE